VKILIEHVDKVCSADSWLKIITLCSIRIRARSLVIPQNRKQNSNIKLYIQKNIIMPKLTLRQSFFIYNAFETLKFWKCSTFSICVEFQSSRFWSFLISFQSSITKQIHFCGDSLIENLKPVPILDFEQFLIILPARQKSMIFFYKTTTNLSRIHAIIAKQKNTCFFPSILHM